MINRSAVYCDPAADGLRAARRRRGQRPDAPRPGRPGRRTDVEDKITEWPSIHHSSGRDPQVRRDSSLTSAAPAGTMSGTTRIEGTSAARKSPADGVTDTLRTGKGWYEPHIVLAPRGRPATVRVVGRPQTRNRPPLLGP
ncbi:hypothetical protein SCOCK_150125 [Actinacidiphila cocklensis]|uniref:Uncharacterized protein n=1 Tax=Actinacidiphila cocklensis TaxID=887465 RepID=A0A9W4DQG6_9ACTN|nr:hypothetical protein SCOCK_150125 [Actinacidiphila cocklensis]